MFAVIGPGPVMVTGVPEMVVYCAIVCAVFAVPEKTRPSVVDAFDTTDSVPSAGTVGFRVTVSLRIKPFVLATDKFRGDVADEIDVFEAEPWVKVVPSGTEYGYVEKMRFAYAGFVD